MLPMRILFAGMCLWIMVDCQTVLKLIDYEDHNGQMPIPQLQFAAEIPQGKTFDLECIDARFPKLAIHSALYQRTPLKSLDETYFRYTSCGPLRELDYENRYEADGDPCERDLGLEIQQYCGYGNRSCSISTMEEDIGEALCGIMNMSLIVKFYCLSPEAQYSGCSSGTTQDPFCNTHRRSKFCDWARGTD